MTGDRSRSPLKQVAYSALRVLMWVGPAATAGAVPAALISGPPAVQVSPRPEGGHLLKASFAVAASPEVAWQVLTDYAGLPRFVESLNRSIVVDRNNGIVRVEQEGTGRLGFLTHRVHVLLTIEENSSSDRLDFYDTSGASFHLYRGAWTVKPREGGVLVTYQLEAHPRFFAPGPLARRASQSNVRSLLGGVRAEMERRARTAQR